MADQGPAADDLGRHARAHRRRARAAAPAAYHAAPDFAAADAFVWHPDGRRLAPVPHVNRVEMALLKGIDRVRDTLIENTERFAKGLPANNALLWGARGMGKSSLVKAAHAAVNAARAKDGRPLKLVEIHREDIESLPDADGAAARRALPLHRVLRRPVVRRATTPPTSRSRRCWKAASKAGRTTSILYATSNRRHLMPRDMMENERSTAINPGEAVEEKVSLSDRFGLWLGFHRCSQDEFLAMVEGYVDALPHSGRAPSAAARGAGMGDHARRALRPRGLAIRAGSGGTARRPHRGAVRPR